MATPAGRRRRPSARRCPRQTVPRGRSRVDAVVQAARRVRAQQRERRVDHVFDIARRDDAVDEDACRLAGPSEAMMRSMLLRVAGPPNRLSTRSTKRPALRGPATRPPASTGRRRCADWGGVLGVRRRRPCHRTRSPCCSAPASRRRPRPRAPDRARQTRSPPAPLARRLRPGPRRCTPRSSGSRLDAPARHGLAHAASSVRSSAPRQRAITSAPWR